MAIDNDWSFEDRREYERNRVNFYLRVVDLDSDGLLGEVMDISETGMRLHSEAPIPVGHTFRVQMDIALGMDCQEVCFETRSVWSLKERHLGLYVTGFRNTFASDAAASIQRLIDKIISMK